MANQNLELALKIKALVEGAKNIQALAGDVQRLQGLSGKPLKDPTPQLRDGIGKTTSLVNELTNQLAGLFSLNAIKNFVSNSIAEFNKAEAGFRGLEAVANRSGVGIGRAMQEAEKLAADGYLGLQDAQKALQNLLSRGYDVDQATQTIEALKNSAITGRSAHLSLSEAVVSATEGLKNENSILVDNAGVTKNVSILWKEYAASIGKSVTELTQAEKVQAEHNGILRETAAFAGQAAAGMGSLQQQMAALAAEQKKASAEMGAQLMPVMLEVTRAGVFMIQNFFKPAIFFAQSFGIGLAKSGQELAAFGRLLKTRNLTAYREEMQRIADLAEEMKTEAAGKLDAGLQFTPNPLAGGTGGGSTTTSAGPPKAQQKAAEKAARDLADAQRALQVETSEQAARLEQDDLARQIAANERAYADKLIDAQDYYAALSEFQRQQADSEIRALEAKRVALSAAGGSAADQVKTQAEILRIDTEIELVQRRVSQQQIDAVRLRMEALKPQQEFIDGLEQEAFLSGLSNDERETALMLLEAEKLGITDVNRLLEAQGEIRANNNAKKAAEDLQRQQDSLYESVQQGVQRAFADGLNAVGTDGGVLGALKNAVDTVKNAMSNALAGSFTDSFLGMLGGKAGVLNIAGSLGLGGKKDGSSPASAIYVQDVSAAGGALGAAAGGEGGGIFSKLSSMLGNLFGGLKSALSNIVSGIGNALSGLFGGGGGGQGFFGAIASMFGFADGGYTGAGGKYQPAGVVHAGEYVFNAESVRRLGLGALDNLHRIASGGFAPRMPRWGYADGGAVNLPGAAAPVVNASTRIVNFFDMDSALSDYLNTRGGERAVLNIIQRNPRAAGG